MAQLLVVGLTMFKMQLVITKILIPIGLIPIGLVLLGLTAMSQKTRTFTFGKDSTDMFRGFGLGFEYYSGHKKMSKII